MLTKNKYSHNPPGVFIICLLFVILSPQIYIVFSWLIILCTCIILFRSSRAKNLSLKLLQFQFDTMQNLMLKACVQGGDTSRTCTAVRERERERERKREREREREMNHIAMIIQTGVGLKSLSRYFLPFHSSIWTSLNPFSLKNGWDISLLGINNWGLAGSILLVKPLSLFQFTSDGHQCEVSLFLSLPHARLNFYH